MNTSSLESLTPTPGAQESARASSTYTVASINCQATTGSIASVGDTENDSPPRAQTSSSSTSQTTLKVFAPVMTQEVTLPNTSQKVPMVMVPVPDNGTLMAIPYSTLNQLNNAKIEPSQDEQQARELLVWKNGVGTLEGCDLRFKINPLGCLELLDSDDESENQNSSKQRAISTNSNQSNRNNFKANKTTNGVPDAISKADGLPKRSKLEADNAPVRQISPGSSLLRDGPNLKRAKLSSSSSGSNPSNRPPSCPSLSLLKKPEQNHNSILLEKLILRDRVESLKPLVPHWKPGDVSKFVNTIPGCWGLGELFEKQQICGKSLLYLDQRDLLDTIRVKLGPAVKLYHVISLFK